jgi:hypothetical protein
MQPVGSPLALPCFRYHEDVSYVSFLFPPKGWGVGLQGLCKFHIPMFQSVSPPAGSETNFDIEQWTLGNITKTHFVMPVGHNPMLGIFSFL